MSWKSRNLPLRKLAEKKVILAACPSCLRAAGRSEADLAPGGTIADKTQFTTLTRGRIIKLDY